jgi:hypothetical protein
MKNIKQYIKQYFYNRKIRKEIEHHLYGNIWCLESIILLIISIFLWLVLFIRIINSI